MVRCWRGTWRRRGAALLLGSLGSLPALPALASDGPAAELRSVSGVVFTQRPGGEVQIAQANAKLAVGDTVGTQKGAFALVVFGDGSRVALRPESALAIRGFSYKPDDPAADQMSVQLLKGWLRNVSGQIGKRGNAAAFELRVNDTTIGIRGTDFAVRLCDEACASAEAAEVEGVLPQSGRLGQVLSSSGPVLRQAESVEPVAAVNVNAGSTLFLGDTVRTGEREAVLALDDGTRMVMAPRSAVVLRAEEDAKGRRAVRVDLQDGVLRVATPEVKGARLYGLLLNAGETVGVRQATNLDISCDAPASGGFGCSAGQVLLRRGQAEILGEKQLRSVKAGGCEGLGPAASSAGAAGCETRSAGLFDPQDIASDVARPQGAHERPSLGVYTAVFEGQVELRNPFGRLPVSSGQGGFAPTGKAIAPGLLPAAPRFMELDKELDRAKLFPQSCIK